MNKDKNNLKTSTTDTPADLEIMQECQLKGLKILGFKRTKINEWPDEELHGLIALSQSTLTFTAVTQSRFPIKNLRIQAKAEGISFECKPVKSVIYPEKAELIPDPLSPNATIDVPGNTTMMFLIKSEIPATMAGKQCEVTIEALSDSHAFIEKKIPLKIPQGIKLSMDKSWDTNIVFWYHWKALCDYYHMEMWSEEFWVMADCYLAEMAKAGHNGIFLTVKDDPFRYPMPKRYYRNHEKPCPIIWQKSGNSWSFDYSRYDRYVELNMKHGIDKEIECHCLLPCKNQTPALTYYDLDQKEYKEIETTFDAPEYRESWQAFLIDFVKHNKEKGWDHLLTLCPYDEPTNPETFRATAMMAKEVAPDIRICAAIQAEIACELKDVLDIATLHLSSGYSREKRDYLKELGVELRWYNCCYPDWGNTLFSCGLADSYRIPWITFANNFNGYLRWSIFNVTRDVYENPGFNWPTGDMYLLYPGEEGRPDLSLRWEAIKAGFQDVTLVVRAFSSPSLSVEMRKKLETLIKFMGKDEAIELPFDILKWRNEIYACLSLDA